MTERWSKPFLIGLALRALLPWYAHGFRYMDEHWQVIEPANSLLHRAWSITTEWQHGMRSWIYPGLVSLPMKLAEALGMSDPLWIAAFTKFAHGLVSALAIPLIYFATRAACARLGNQTRNTAAVSAAWFVALWPFALYCGIHTHGEMAGALFVLAGAAAPLLVKNEFRAYVAAGAAFGAALALKIDVAVAGLGYGLWWAGQFFFTKEKNRRLALRRTLLLAVGVMPFVLLLGLVDRLTWGSWFQSVLGHARANLVEGVGNQWGVSPWYKHVIYYFDIAGVPSLVAFLGLPWAWRKLPGEIRATWFMNAFFVAVFCAVPHKEKRFLAPLVYTSQLAAFTTLAFLWESHRSVLRRKREWRLAALVCAVLLVAHGAANAFTYLIQRAWWDRIGAMHDAGRIPGIQKMISPQWPAIFYLPRHVPAESTGADRESIEKATRGLRSIGVATDWKDFQPLTSLGFQCHGWPEPAPGASTKDPVPHAYKCER